MDKRPAFAQIYKRLSLRNKSTQNGTDTISLAGALGLLSPSKDIMKSTEYKPSLFRNLQKGSVNEQFAEISNQAPMNFDASQLNHQQSIASLITDLSNATAHVSWPKSAHTEDLKRREMVKNLNAHVKSLRSETELLDLVRSAYTERKLSFQLLMQFLLNKNLKNLSKLPFDVSNINMSEFAKHGWTSANVTELKILLLKKYHDLERPLEIVKTLKHSFSTEFLPAIQARNLSPFYERIVWKFYFEYIGLGQETATIERLDSLRCSFLIWESTTEKNAEILEKIISHHSLNTPQSLFLRVASFKPVQAKIDEELSQGNSPLLSSLKRISWKFRIYAASATNDVASRAFSFSLIHKLEDILGTAFANTAEIGGLDELMKTLKAERTQMIKSEVADVEQESVAYAH